MYKGKFDQKNRGSSVSVEEIVAQRNAAPKRKRPAPPMEEPEILRKGPAAEPVPEKIAVRVHSKGSGKEPATAMASAPLRRTTPNPAEPAGVDMAAMVCVIGIPPWGMEWRAFFAPIGQYSNKPMKILAGFGDC